MNEEYELSYSLNELFKSIYRKSSLKLPIKKKNDIVSDFFEKCENYNLHLSNYIEEDAEQLLEIIPEIITTSKQLQAGIIKTLTLFLTGDIQAAYNTFDKTLSSRVIYRNLRRISVPLRELCDVDKPLFRVRKSDKPLSERKDLFHIPFSMRHLVNAQRYSVAGLPCLYLGTSIYICWQEMDKPDLSKLYISAFISDDSRSQVLNLAADFLFHRTRVKRPRDISSRDNNEKIAYLILWPLIAACNYIKSDGNSPFIQEYIIPNLLMQWISRKDNTPISGIAYRSTRFSKRSQSPQAVNVVLPPKVDYYQIIENDFSLSLCSMFDFTPPVSWQIVNTLDYAAGSTMTEDQEKALEVLKRKQRTGIINFDEDLVSLYPLTDFYKLEVFIDRYMDYNTLSPVKDGGKLATELLNKLKSLETPSN